mmetsp:Transcript_19/g.27  ORF Transcript_19/g.27 Transcript_19/m.27 type:complete len:159 (+) Transcript_19:68-544(+)
MGLTARQLAYAKLLLPLQQYLMAAKYWNCYDDVAVNMIHRNIQELLVQRGYVPNKGDHRSYRLNSERGAHNSVDLWYKHLPKNGYGDPPDDYKNNVKSDSTSNHASKSAKHSSTSKQKNKLENDKENNVDTINRHIRHDPCEKKKTWSSVVKSSMRNE